MYSLVDPRPHPSAMLAGSQIYGSLPNLQLLVTVHDSPPAPNPQPLTPKLALAPNS